MTLHQDRVLAQLRALEEGRDRALRRFSELGSERPALNKPRPEAALAAQFRGDAGSDVAVADVEAGLAEYEAELARIDRESDAAHAAMLGFEDELATLLGEEAEFATFAAGPEAQTQRALAAVARLAAAYREAEAEWHKALDAWRPLIGANRLRAAPGFPLPSLALAGGVQDALSGHLAPRPRGLTLELHQEEVVRAT